AEDTSSLSDSYIQSLCEDNQGRIWVGTSSGTIDFFDHASGKFVHVIQDSISSHKVPNGPVGQILEDKKGNILAQFGNKMIIIKPSIVNSNLSYGFTFEEYLFPLDILNASLFITKFGTIYLSQNFSPIFYEFVQPSHEWSLHKLEIEHLKENRIHDPLNIYQIHEDTITNNLYIICNLGIIRFNNGKALERLLNYPIDVLKPSFMDYQGNIWFCKGDSLSTFNLKSRSIRFLSAQDEINTLRIRLINSAYVDRSGMIWIGSKGYGIIKINYQARRFHHTDNSSVFAITELDDDRIVINSGGNLAKTLDMANGTYTDTFDVQDAKVYFENFNELSFPSIKGRKNRRWFADQQRLAYYNVITKETRSFPFPVKQSNKNYSMVSDLKEDETGRIWTGTMEGLFCFNPENATWSSYKTDPKDNRSLSFNSIFSLCFDPIAPDKYLWIGTNGGGLNRMDITTGKCDRYSIKNGLPNNVVYGILQDNNNNLWMSTNKGLSCFNVLQQTFKNYEDKDGLQSNEFNHNAYLRSKDGILFFGGVHGYNYFNPDEIETNQIAPKIVITDLMIRNKSVSPGQLNSPLQYAPYLTKKIILPYRDNMITFEFAALDFIAPDKNQYKYKMENFDQDWVNSGNIHSATYTNLDPGTYTFKANGTNKDGVWGERSASILLTIIPPWYMTWWFRGFVLSLACIGAYGFYKYRLNQTLKLMAIRNRIATDLHDEIGSNLSNIAIFSEVAQQKSDEKQDLLKKISSYTQTSMDAMNDIVWMVNTRNDRFENIINRMRQLAGEVLEAKGYSVHLTIDERINSFSMNMEERKNFYLIYKEAVNNIAKYARGTEVWISMKVNQDDVTLRIKDNGVGFDTKTISSGNGLINLRARTNALKGQLFVLSVPGEGTEIKLKFNV
ncbi:MAG: two-component regulator propeller domain-containing protein, partial [Saprospiraceae bacterium]